jgi:hypothetical protein
MSADNGIYILKTPRPPKKVKWREFEGKDVFAYENQHGKYEYRVAHCQAIDNIDHSDLYLPVYFGKSPVYHDHAPALQDAILLAKQYEVLEYGICDVEKQCYFPNMKPETAEKALDCYEGAEPV